MAKEPEKHQPKKDHPASSQHDQNDRGKTDTAKPERQGDRPNQVKPPPPQPEGAGAVQQGVVPTQKDGDVTNRATRALSGSGRPGVSAQADHVHPRAHNSGFPVKQVDQQQTDEFHRMYFPGQGLQSPEDHPDHPEAIVNQPYGSEPQLLNPATGTARYRRPDPETTGADYQPDRQ